MMLVRSAGTRLALAVGLCAGTLLGACEATQAGKVSTTSPPQTLGWRVTAQSHAGAASGAHDQSWSRAQPSS